MSHFPMYFLGSPSIFARFLQLLVSAIEQSCSFPLSFFAICLCVNVLMLGTKNWAMQMEAAVSAEEDLPANLEGAFEQAFQRILMTMVPTLWEASAFSHSFLVLERILSGVILLKISLFWLDIPSHWFEIDILSYNSQKRCVHILKQPLTVLVEVLTPATFGARNVEHFYYVDFSSSRFFGDYLSFAQADLELVVFTSGRGQFPGQDLHFDLIHIQRGNIGCDWVVEGKNLVSDPLFTNEYRRLPVLLQKLGIEDLHGISTQKIPPQALNTR